MSPCHNRPSSGRGWFAGGGMGQENFLCAQVGSVPGAWEMVDGADGLFHHARKIAVAAGVECICAGGLAPEDFLLPRGNRYVVANIGAALPRWGKGRCVGAGRRCLPAARALRCWRASDFGVWDDGGERNFPACKLAGYRARGERRAGCFAARPHAQSHGSGGATAGPARTRLRALSLKNPIGCRANPVTLQR